MSNAAYSWMVFVFSESLNSALITLSYWVFLFQRQLSNEARQFQRADKAWRDLIQTAEDKISALKFGSIPGTEICFMY